MFYGGLTYCGHPLSCAAGVAAIDAYRDERLIERSRRLGAQMFAELQKLAERHPVIGDVRGGHGLFAVVELVADRATRAPLAPWPPSPRRMKALLAAARAEGVSFGSRGNLIILAPPLVIAEAELADRARPCSTACWPVSSLRPWSAPHELSPDLRDDVQSAGGDARALRGGARDDARRASARRTRCSSTARTCTRPTTEERAARSTTASRPGASRSRATHDVDAAIAAAHARLSRLARRRHRAKRVALMRKVADIMEERVYEIAAALTLEVGKNRMEALGEAQEMRGFLQRTTRTTSSRTRATSRPAERSARRRSSRATRASCGRTACGR